MRATPWPSRTWRSAIAPGSLASSDITLLLQIEKIGPVGRRLLSTAPSGYLLEEDPRTANNSSHFTAPSEFLSARNFTRLRPADVEISKTRSSPAAVSNRAICSAGERITAIFIVFFRLSALHLGSEIPECAPLLGSEKHAGHDRLLHDPQFALDLSRQRAVCRNCAAQWCGR